ncbi:hypothetical protein BHE74_00003426 [Ensete ventricosum]|nr:hypothetical protein BHE74_00003426 [Ensete ventricosum]
MLEIKSCAGGGRQRAGRHSCVRRVIHAVGDIWVLCPRPWVVVNARSVTWEVETTPSVPSQPSCGGGPYSRDTRPHAERPPLPPPSIIIIHHGLPAPPSFVQALPWVLGSSPTPDAASRDVDLDRPLPPWR